MVHLESGTSRSRAVMGYRIRIGILWNWKYELSRLKNENSESRIVQKSRILVPNRGIRILKQRVKVLSSIVFFTVNRTENEKFGFLRLTGPILKNEIGFFRWDLRLGGFWIKIRNLNLVQEQKLGIRNLESLNWKPLIESIWQPRSKTQDLKTWNWFWWIREIELSKSGIKNQVESSGNRDLNPEIGWLSWDFWLIIDKNRSNWRIRILKFNQLKTKRIKSVEKNWIAAFWIVQNLKWALFLKRWKE